jgi:hypothetical protein
VTDEQRLHDRLEAAVSLPPDLADGGPRARERWRRNRRRRVGAVVAVAAVVAVGVPALRLVDTRHDTAPTISGTIEGTIQGTGHAACRGVGSGHHDLGDLVDTRVVDSPTATAWLRAVHSSADVGAVAGGRAVDVCLFYGSPGVYTVVAGVPGRSPVVVSRGRFLGTSAPITAMQTLDELWSGGATTSDAPFACPSSTAPVDETVSNALPSGSTGALLCYTDGTNLYSPREILSLDDSDRLVTLVDAAKISYTPPNAACGGIAGFRDYSIVFRYPTGTRVVRDEECRGLAIGSYTRQAPHDLDVRLERLLPHGLAADLPPCPPPDSGPSGVGDIRHLVAVRSCTAGDDTGQVLSGHRLRSVQRWGAAQFAGSTEPNGACVRPAEGWPHLTLVDTWGNAFTATVECQRHLVSVLADAPGHPAFYPVSFRGDFGRRLSQLTH